jgi:hypothetical protein
MQRGIIEVEELGRSAAFVSPFGTINCGNSACKNNLNAEPIHDIKPSGS